MVYDTATGDWAREIDTFNTLIEDQNEPLTGLSEVVEHITKGDLSYKMPVEIEGRPLKGEYHRFARASNQMIEQLEAIVHELNRVSREVGRDGKLGGQAILRNVKGDWAELTQSVNEMANNLTAQVRGVALVTSAVATGDLTKKITVDARGEVLELKNTINIMVDQLNNFSTEVTRVAREVGTDGVLGGQAQVQGVSGTWKELTDSVNHMATNLTNQVRDIARVATAVAGGDLTKKITVEVKGEILQLKDTINTMVDQLFSFSEEVTRVAREVGTEGTLGGQADVKGVAGTWRDLTDNVNVMASNLTNQVRNIAEVATAVANGDLSRKVAVEAKGEILDLTKTINTMVDQLSTFSQEVTRVARDVGTEGLLGGQATVEGVKGTWKDLTDNVNTMATNLTNQVRNIAQVATAVAEGDLSKKVAVQAKGEILQLSNTINVMVDQLGIFSQEVTRVAQEVGTEGILGGQAEVRGVSGTWRELTQSVNTMAANLTSQVRDIAKVSTAVANGDLGQKITVEVKGEILQLKDTINTMVDQLSTFSQEVTRVARDVGTEGVLGGQATVEGVKGTWKDLTDNVNTMANNLTEQVRTIAKVATAVAEGDLSKKVSIEARGEILELTNTINLMVDQLNMFSGEVTRVAREVGTEGILGGQARVENAQGIWKDLTNNVNTMAGNLTNQVRNIAQVATAVAGGNLTQKVAIEAKGEFLTLMNTINTMVDQLSTFSQEVTRVAREVGTEGVLGGQATVEGVSGTWKDLTENVNTMANNLTNQVRNIAEVATAVAQGDLSRTITVDAQGEILQLKNTINLMVRQLNTFSLEVTRVAKDVGTEGILGGQAEVEGVSGAWKALTDNVNTMASNLTAQVRDIAKVTTAVANGDLGQQITVEVKGEVLELKDTINTMVEQLRLFSEEVTRLAKEVGTDGVLGGQAQVKGVSGAWKALTDNVNAMADNLTNQVRNIAEVATAVANGDLSRTITVDARGEILRLKETLNTMVDQLSTFSQEVTRVAREVGTEGILGGQATVEGVSGAWQDLTSNVNIMASNLTSQVRDIAKVATAVANGDLTQQITVDVKGEILELKVTINRMTETLSTFAEQVTQVAREVGIEGKLGGKAEVPGAAGLWRDLTDNVNELADNLSRQVRAIAEVATRVTDGDLTGSIVVEARGEVESLKNNLNQMIRSLADTTRANEDQDWLKSNLASFSGTMQGKRDLQVLAQSLISDLATLVNAHHGVFYLLDEEAESTTFKLLASYGYASRKHLSSQFLLGEGLVGQCALEKDKIIINHVPEDYIKINSALGEASPRSILVLPVMFESDVRAVIELAAFDEFSALQYTFLDQLTLSMGIVLNSVAATTRTDALLKESQSLSEELQQQQEELKSKNDQLESQAQTLKASEETLKSQQEELQQTNEELETKAQTLSDQKAQIELKNTEVEQAKHAVEQKAEELALSSKYKSEFLANMSHELRTPLNSLLVLSEILKKNTEGNLEDRQLQSIETIHNAGKDLLILIDDILDLAKIEAGKMSVDVSQVQFESLKDTYWQTFSQIATNKGIGLDIQIHHDLPHSMRTDEKRLQQVLKNLLSNALKFTQKGQVTLNMALATEGWSEDHPTLKKVSRVVAFSVIDTGIGIAADKQRVIWEAFQQEDGTTSRKFGGTGLGLSISREITRLLGGELTLQSQVGEGSTFTLFLPLDYVPLAHTTVHSQPDQRRASSPTPRQHQEPQVEETFHEEVDDDRRSLTPGTDRVVLIIEDDRTFAQILLDSARQQGFKGVIALSGDTGLTYAARYKPNAIILDLHLPIIHGWTVLDRLKHDPDLRHIPVHMVSGDEVRQRSLKLGAISFLKKPIDEQQLSHTFQNIKGFLDQGLRHLLVVEDDANQQQSIRELIGNGDVQTDFVNTIQEAIEALETQSYDCMVLDLMLPGEDGFQLIEQIKNQERFINLPIIVYTGKELTPEEDTKLKAVAETIVIKGVDSPQRLLAETSLFLHRVEAQLPESKRQMLRQVHESDPQLAGRKVLIVDDDVRNIFALSSLVEAHQMKVLHAESGKEALQSISTYPDIDVILMDIMMPEMDGYETIQAIRAIPQFMNVPIIAVTAKAMKGDREKCLEAGASDYITKPIDSNQLFSLLRVWLY